MKKWHSWAMMSVFVGWMSQSAPQTSDLLDVKWGEQISCSFQIVIIADPITVRNIKGKLVNEAGGAWPRNVAPLIELVNKKDQRKKYSTVAKVSDGAFEVRRVPSGDYFFQAGVREVGWECVLGYITVSKSAPVDSQVEITVPVGK